MAIWALLLLSVASWWSSWAIRSPRRPVDLFCAPYHPLFASWPSSPSRLRLMCARIPALSSPSPSPMSSRDSQLSNAPRLSGRSTTHTTPTPHFHRHVSMSGPKKRGYRCNRHRSRQRQPHCLHPRDIGGLSGVWSGWEGRRDDFLANSRKAGDPYVDNGASAAAFKGVCEPCDHPKAPGNLFSAAANFSRSRRLIFPAMEMGLQKKSERTLS